MCSSTQIPARRSVLPLVPVPDGPAIRPHPQTSAAADAAQVAALAAEAGSIPELDALISVCRACPRLVSWREDVAVVKRRAFADQPYWGRPVPGWGSERPLVIDRRAGAGRARRQPDRTDVHRRPVRRPVVRGTV